MKEMKAHIDPILVFVHCELRLLFCHFINATAYQLVSYKPSSPCAKELHARTLLLMVTTGVFEFSKSKHNCYNTMHGILYYGGRMYWRQIVEVKIIRKGVQQQRITSCQSQYEQKKTVQRWSQDTTQITVIGQQNDIVPGIKENIYLVQIMFLISFGCQRRLNVQFYESSG